MAPLLIGITCSHGCARNAEVWDPMANDFDRSALGVDDERRA